MIYRLEIKSIPQIPSIAGYIDTWLILAHDPRMFMFPALWAIFIITNMDSPTELSICYNDGSEESLITLNALKNIMSSQLAIPRVVITRGVFDPRFESLVMKRNGKVVGGVTYRWWRDQKACILQFFAVDGDYRRQGFGKTIIQHLKIQCEDKKINNIVAQSDEFSIQFYFKHGFIQCSEQEERQWEPYLSEYENTKLVAYKVYEDGNHTPGSVMRVAEQMKSLKTQLDGLKYRQFSYSSHEIEQMLAQKIKVQASKQKHFEYTAEGAASARLTYNLIKRLKENSHSWVIQAPLLGKEENQKQSIMTLTQIEELMKVTEPSSQCLRACSEIRKTLEIMCKELQPDSSVLETCREFMKWVQPLIDQALYGIIPSVAGDNILSNENN